MEMNFNFPNKICTIINNNIYDVADYLKINKILSYNSRFGRPTMTDNFEIGHNCITGIDYNVATELKNKFNVSVEDIKEVITNSLLNNLQIGDKVRFIEFGGREVKGTVIECDNKLLIRKYRCSSKIYEFNIGEIIDGLTIGW